MPVPTAAVVGSGVAATAVVQTLISRGWHVSVFEKGPDYAYPHTRQFRELVHYRYSDPRHTVSADLNTVTQSGDYRGRLTGERRMVVGGSATRWHAISLRMRPNDFRTRTLYGVGDDWPVSYDELEPYYCRAEALLGVSGTDADNPFAARRSQDYPLPPFELTPTDRRLAERLRHHGLFLHTTPQARTRRPHDGRPGCLNFGTCSHCPIGARYSPTVHLMRAIETGRCTVRSNASVRRIVAAPSGRVRGVVYRDNARGGDVEHAASVVILAAGTIESARLLLLSSTSHHPDGLGQRSGHVGRHLTFHHLWRGRLQYGERMNAGRLGPVTGQSHQFLDHRERGRYGAVQVDFSANDAGLDTEPSLGTTARAVVDARRQFAHSRGMLLQAEALADERRSVSLSKAVDRFGDPFAHVHYQLSDFDARTYDFARSLFDRFGAATRGERVAFQRLGEYDTGYHHMGTCRMAVGERDGVVDPFGRVHGTANCYVVGAAAFVGSSGAVNPTLTLVALALRTADRIAEQNG